MLSRKSVVVLASLAVLSGAAHAQSANQQFMQKTFELGGMLLRAGKVCDKDQEDFIRWSFRLQTLDDEVRSIGKAFPDLTTKWMVGGAELMNTMIMNQGMKPACQVAFKQMQDAAGAIIANNEKQRQGRQR